MPDALVGVVLQSAYGHTSEQCQIIKIEPQDTMCAENCIGALLGRYINCKLNGSDWVWGCGDFVKEIDFILPVPQFHQICIMFEYVAGLCRECQMLECVIVESFQVA